MSKSVSCGTGAVSVIVRHQQCGRMEVAGRYCIRCAAQVYFCTCRTSLSRPSAPSNDDQAGLTTTPTLASHASLRISQDHPGSSRIGQDLPRCSPSSSLLPFSILQRAWPISVVGRRKRRFRPASCPDPGPGSRHKGTGIIIGSLFAIGKKGWRRHGKGNEGKGKRGLSAK